MHAQLNDYSSHSRRNRHTTTTIQKHEELRGSFINTVRVLLEILVSK